MNTRSLTRTENTYANVRILFRDLKLTANRRREREKLTEQDWH